MDNLTSNVTDSRDRSQEEIRDWMVSQLATQLNVQPDEIDVDAPFESYSNLSSAEALVLLNQLQEYVGFSVPPTLFWNYPTIESLAERLAEGE